MKDVLVVMRMGRANTVAHLAPLAAAINPARLHVVRPAPLPHGLDARNVVYTRVRGRWRPLEVAHTLVKALSIARRNDLGLIVSFNAYPYGLFAALCGILTGTPFHVGFVGSDLRKARRRPWWLRPLLKAAFITAPGDGASADLAALGFGGPVYRLEHGVDPERFRPGDGTRDVDVVFVGALIHRKRVDRIVDALASVRDAWPDLSAVIVGDGPLRQELERQVLNLDLGEAVRFVGPQPEPERWLRRAKLFVMSSEWEGLPYALVEAMRCGAVPICTPAGSTDELITDGQNGVIASEGTAADLARHMMRLLDDPQVREEMSTRAFTSTEDLTHDAVERSWRHMLNTAIGTGTKETLD